MLTSNHFSSAYFDLSTEMKSILDERLQEDEATYLTAEECIKQLDKKYRLHNTPPKK